MTSTSAAGFINRTHSRSIVIAAGTLSALGYGFLALQSTAYGSATLAHLLWACGVGGSAVFALFFLARRYGLTLCWSDILFFAVAYRVIGVFAFPVLEDDFYRYLWDGWQTVTQGTPYGLAPAAYFGVDVADRWSDVLSGISYPELATVYGPTAQWLFAASYLLAPAEVWPLQVFAAASDIGVVLMLKRLAPLRWVLLYAWSPLLIKEFAFTAHVDVVGVALLMAALVLRSQQRTDAHAWQVSAVVGVLLALACGVKVFAVLAVPFLLQNDWRGWLVFLSGCVVVALPFGICEAWLPAGLQTMGGSWVFNAPVYLSTAALWGWSNLEIVRWVCMSVFAAAAAALFLRACGAGFRPLVGALASRRPKVAVEAFLGELALLFGLLLFLLPAFNPWYMVWWLAFAAVRPSATAWSCSVAVLMSYATGINLGGQGLQLYEQPAWVLWLEFLPVAAALIYDLKRFGRTPS